MEKIIKIENILHKVQKELKVPKNQTNTFGKYKYRSCEDILDELKKILPDGVFVLLSDEVVNVGADNYVKATASINSENGMISTTAYAREAQKQAGMQDAQLTGSTSSYARKYALNGLFMIDDTKDSDATNKHGKDGSKSESQQQGSTDKATPPQIKLIAAKLYSKAMEGKLILEEFKIDKLENLPKSKVNDVLEFIEKS